MGTEKLNLLLETIPTCQACRLCTKPISPSYDDSAQIDLFVIVENPTLEESQLDWSFGTRAHKYIATLIAPIFPLQNVYFTYMVKCHIGIKLGVGNSNACINQFLDQELELIKPKAILTMGQNCGKIVGRHYGMNIEVGGMYEGDYSSDKQFRLACSESAVTLYNKGKKKEKEFIELLNVLQKGN